jgi:hypothetical protein
MKGNCSGGINAYYNADTRRRNAFWGSMTRLAKIIKHRIEYSSPSVYHHSKKRNRRALLVMRNIGEAEIFNQGMQYRVKTEDKLCDHHISFYYSNISGTCVLCYHLIYVNIPRSKMHEPLVLIRSTDRSDFCVALKKITRSGERLSLWEINTLVKIPAQAMKKRSKANVKVGEVIGWVRQNLLWQAYVIAVVSKLPTEVLIITLEILLRPVDMI